MIWIAPSQKYMATDTPEIRLRDAADQFRANSRLKPQESKTFAGRAPCCRRLCGWSSQ
jgi:hypothetical protein